MKAPMKWIRELIDPGMSVGDLAHRLTMAGLEAEKISQIGEMWADKVYVGYVRQVSQHPNADRLVLADVEAGEHRLTVVTGAPNIAAGQKVMLALAGARLYDGHSNSPAPEIKTLKPGAIRGINSDGMVCSEKELGLSDEHEGILVLPDDAPVGMLAKDYLGDTVIEFEITPNLAHAFSILGIAREVRALNGAPITQPETIDLAEIADAPANVVTIEDAERCNRYMVLLVDNLNIEPSPLWLSQRLEAAGMRPINNVVDVTNFVMHELGCPMHAFDRDRLEEGRVIVRPAHPGERLQTLDHIDRALTESMTVIADAARPVGLAGIIGGFDAEVSNDTTRVLLEVAHFDPTITRGTSRALRVRTEASARYERGVDSESLPMAVARAAWLIRRVCPGAILTGLADDYPVKSHRNTISFPYDRVERLLGIEIVPDEALAILRRLDIEAAIDAGTLSVTAPTYRRDLNERQDVIEEIAKIAGYDRLPATLPSGGAQPVHRDPIYRLRKAARSILVGAGFSEAVTYVTVHGFDLDRFSDGEVTGVVVTTPRERTISLRNALQADRNLMRPTLIPALLEVASQNLRHQPSVRLAELARAYIPSPDEVLPSEPELIGIVAAGRREAIGLDVADDEIDFFELKGTIDLILARLGAKGPETIRWRHPAFHHGRSAEVRVRGVVIARYGELHPDTAAAYGIEDHRVVAGEINLTALGALVEPRGRDAFVPRYLPVEQDFAVVVDESVLAADIEAAFRSGAGPLLTNIVLFDRFTGNQIGEGKVSLAYRLTFTAPDRTLTDDDLVKVRPRIERTLRQRVDGVLRV
jgi:phenylalanyl-tRNA synthetase beta chain